MAPEQQSTDLGDACIRLLRREQAAGKDRTWLDEPVREALFAPGTAGKTPARPQATTRPVQPVTPSPAPPPMASRPVQPVASPPVRPQQTPVSSKASASVVPGVVSLSSEEDWKSLASKVEACQACQYCRERQQPVFGEGNKNARLMFVGEGPGAEEDRLGRPFVGPAGEFLDKMIVAMGLSREDVYIANIVKCRPPGNKAPGRSEATACLPYVKRQIQLVNPDVIVTLGNVPMTWILGKTGISRNRGQWHEFEGIAVMPTYHPSYLIRLEGTQRERGVKREVWNDLQDVMTRLGLKRP